MNTGSYDYVSFSGFSPYSETGPYCAADFMRLPEGEPVELLRGRLFVSPAPISYHQYVLAQLWRILQRAEERGEGIGFFSPIDVVFDEKNIVQPDALYLAKDRLPLIGDQINGPPSLVVEVLSPSTANRDRQEKLDLYARFNVPEYWIVDPEAQTIEFLINDGGRYVIVTPVRDVYRSTITPELEIQLADFWREVERRMPRDRS